MNYLRIVIDEKIPVSAAREGFFRTAYTLRREGTLPASTHAELDAYLTFLDNQIDLPDSFSKSRSKGAACRETKGISWFKTEAVEVVEQALALARLLERQGVRTTVLRTNRVGYVTYEDDIQIVAEPFSDTPK